MRTSARPTQTPKPPAPPAFAGTVYAKLFDHGASWSFEVEDVVIMPAAVKEFHRSGETSNGELAWKEGFAKIGDAWCYQINYSHSTDDAWSICVRGDRGFVSTMYRTWTGSATVETRFLAR